MAQELIDYPDGQYAVDTTLLEVIIRSYLYASALLRHSEEKIDEKWIGPDVHRVEIDWAKARRERDRAPNLAWELHSRAQREGMERQIPQLAQMIRETRLARDTWNAKLKKAQEKTMENINDSVRRLELGKDVATAIRNASPGTLAIGATVLSGGTTMGLVGSAAFKSGLDSLITLQDTGNAKAAGFMFAGKFAINLIPAGNGTDKVFFFILKKEAEVLHTGAQALVEGKTMEQALVKSAEKLASEALGVGFGKLLKTQQASQVLRRTLYPMTLKIDYPAKSPFGQMRQAVDLTRGIAKKGLKYAGGKAISAANRDTTSKRVASGSRPVVDAAILMDERLLNQAVQGPNRCEYRGLRR